MTRPKSRSFECVSADGTSSAIEIAEPSARPGSSSVILPLNRALVRGVGECPRSFAALHKFGTTGQRIGSETRHTGRREVAGLTESDIARLLRLIAFLVAIAAAQFNGFPVRGMQVGFRPRLFAFPHRFLISETLLDDKPF